MARLASQSKAGYYATPTDVADMICSFLKAEELGARVLDPCCGTGAAIVRATDGLQARLFGVELEKERAEAAKEVLEQAVKGDLFRVRSKKGAYSLLFVNPPYDYSDGERVRLEHKFLVESSPYLRPGGVLVYIVSKSTISKRTARYLASQYEKFLVYKFPGDSYERFKQVVLFAVKKTESHLDEGAEVKLRSVPYAELKELEYKTDPVYVVPGNLVDEKSFYLRSLEIDFDEVLKEVDEFGVWKHVEDLMEPPETKVKGKILMPLRKGHLAILVACGLCDSVLRKNGRRLLIKGVVRKEPVTKTEYANKTVIETTTDTIKIGIKAVDLDTGVFMNVE